MAWNSSPTRWRVILPGKNVTRLRVAVCIRHPGTAVTDERPKTFLTNMEIRRTHDLICANKNEDHA